MYTPLRREYRKTHPEQSIEEMANALASSYHSPAAYNIVMRIAEAVPTVDPNNVCGSKGTLMNMENAGLVGKDRILGLYNLCNEDIASMIGMTRACQMRIINPESLRKAIDNKSSVLRVEQKRVDWYYTQDFPVIPQHMSITDVMEEVQKKLPRFNNVAQMSV